MPRLLLPVASLLFLGIGAAMGLSPTTKTLRQSYLDRLCLQSDHLPQQATADKLKQLQEAHLQHICFENLGHHGAVGGLPSLDWNTLQTKIFAKRRGGFCFEVNGLYAQFLEEEGYRVRRLPAFPAIDHLPNSGKGIYREQPKHILLHVTDCTQQAWLVDVAFGEPSLHPIRYEMDALQTTPEGMASRLIQEEGMVYLQWLKDNNQWQDRIQWEADAIHLDRPLSYFEPNLELVLLPESIFSKKIICCRLTRDTKTTLAGSQLKITSPRFEVDVDPIITELGSVQNVRRVLEQTFGIPMAATEGLDLTRSIEAPPEVWGSS